jgi:hypothetical protein
MNIQENKILLLSEILDEYEAGTLDMTEMARKCYLSEKEKHYNRISWVHNRELKNHALLRRMNNKDGRDLLRNTNL